MMTDSYGVGKQIPIRTNTLYRFFTRNRQHRVGVEAYSVEGDHNEQFLCEYNLNISHRTTFDDVEKYKI